MIYFTFLCTHTCCVYSFADTPTHTHTHLHTRTPTHMPVACEEVEKLYQSKQVAKEMRQKPDTKHYYKIKVHYIARLHIFRHCVYLNTLIISLHVSAKIGQVVHQIVVQPYCSAWEGQSVTVSGLRWRWFWQCFWTYVVVFGMNQPTYFVCQTFYHWKGPLFSCQIPSVHCRSSRCYVARAWTLLLLLIFL